MYSQWNNQTRTSYTGIFFYKQVAIKQEFHTH